MAKKRLRDYIPPVIVFRPRDAWNEVQTWVENRWTALTTRHYEPCCICGKAVCTREYGHCQCSVARNGAQLTDERWTCSDECWKKATEAENPA